MRNAAPWAAFLLMCFAVLGLTGLFGTYATTLPLERAAVRNATLDQVLTADPARLLTLRPALGSLADVVLAGPGPLATRVEAARRTILEEAAREAQAVASRIRLMLVMVTVLGAALGVGILVLALRPGRG